MLPRKKAQAAMEFILTYGWAILVVIIAISALAYFGVLDVDKWLPSSCMIEPGIACIDHEMTYVPETLFTPATNRLDLVIRNNVGWTIQNIEVNIDMFDKNKETNVDLANSQKSLNNEIRIDDVTDAVNVGINPKSRIAFRKGKKYYLDFTISFINSNSGLTQAYHGYIRGEVK